jgi:hypothetical protein
MVRCAPPAGGNEEDKCQAIVAITYPHLFTALERRHADETIKDPWPDAREAIFGTRLAPGESCTREQRALSKLSTPTTGSSFQPSGQNSNRGSSNASRRPAAGAVPTPVNAASSFQPLNTNRQIWLRHRP